MDEGGGSKLWIIRKAFLRRSKALRLLGIQLDPQHSLNLLYLNTHFEEIGRIKRAH